MRRKGFTLIEIIIVVAIISIIAAVVLGAWGAAKQDEELRERFMSICERDMRAENPYMETAEIIERCELQWDMEKKSRPKPDTVVIVSP